MSCATSGATFFRGVWPHNSRPFIAHHCPRGRVAGTPRAAQFGYVKDWEGTERRRRVAGRATRPVGTEVPRGDDAEEGRAADAALRVAGSWSPVATKGEGE